MSLIAPLGGGAAVFVALMLAIPTSRAWDDTAAQPADTPHEEAADQTPGRPACRPRNEVNRTNAAGTAVDT
jgi:hypothetical protein